MLTRAAQKSSYRAATVRERRPHPSKLLLFVLAAVSAMSAPAVKVDKAAAERGRKLFVSSCGFCHGNDATGSRAPDLVRSALVTHDDNGDKLGPLLHAGIPDKGMPGFPFSADQVSDVSAFLHLRQSEALSSNGVPRDYPLEKLLTGNAETGKAFFEGAGGCAACHSPAGDLAGIANKYTPLMLQHRLLAPRQPGRSADVTLPSGEKASGKLMQLDEFNVGIRDASGWYRSWPLGQVKVIVHDPLEAHENLMTHCTDADIHNLFAYLETLK